MNIIDDLNQNYFDKFGDFPDLIPLIRALGEKEAIQRVRRAISTNEPIDFREEFDVPDGALY